MHHGRGKEAQCVGSEIDDIAFLDDLGASFEVNPLEELSQHLDGLCARYESDPRISIQYPRHEGGMVGFHVVHDQIIGLAASQGLGEIGLPLLFLADVSSVHDGDPVVKDHIGVVGHSFGYDILAFEKVKVEIIDSDILDHAVQGYCHDTWLLSCANIANCFEKWTWITIFVHT